MTDLAHVYWLGGGTGAGKSTISRRLADRYGLRRYDTDRAMGDHTARSDPRATPYLQDFLAMDMDERWANRSPEVMLDTFHWFRGEAFDLIAEDLLNLPPEPNHRTGKGLEQLARPRPEDELAAHVAELFGLSEPR